MDGKNIVAKVHLKMFDKHAPKGGKLKKEITKVGFTEKCMGMFEDFHVTQDEINQIVDAVRNIPKGEYDIDSSATTFAHVYGVGLSCIRSWYTGEACVFLKSEMDYIDSIVAEEGLKKKIDSGEFY